MLGNTIYDFLIRDNDETISSDKWYGYVNGDFNIIKKYSNRELEIK